MKIKNIITLCILFLSMSAVAQVELSTKDSVPLSSTEKKEESDKKIISPVNNEKKSAREYVLPSDCGRCIKLGLGIDYLYYTQKPPGSLKEVEFKDLVAPAVMFEGYFNMTDKWRMRVEYVKHPDVKLDTSKINFSNSSVGWNFLGVGADYKMFKSFALLKHLAIPKVFFAYQMQNLPYLQQSNNTYKITTESVDTISLGYHLDIGKLKSKINYYMSNRIQVPVASKGQLKWKNGFGFEGVLGAFYAFNNELFLDVSWGGQFHQYQYQDGTVTGDYKIGNSQLNFGLGYIF